MAEYRWTAKDGAECFIKGTRDYFSREHAAAEILRLAERVKFLEEVNEHVNKDVVAMTQSVGDWEDQEARIAALENELSLERSNYASVFAENTRLDSLRKRLEEENERLAGAVEADEARLAVRDRVIKELEGVNSRLREENREQRSLLAQAIGHFRYGCADDLADRTVELLTAYRPGGELDEP